MLPLLTIAAALAAPPEATGEVLRDEALPVEVALPAGQRTWEYLLRKGGQVPITLSHPYRQPPLVTMGAIMGFQPDLAGTSDGGLRTFLVDAIPGADDVPEAVEVERAHRDNLGDIVVIRYTTEEREGHPPVEAEAVLAPVEAGVFWLLALQPPGRGDLAASVDEVLSMVRVTRPAAPADSFTTGHFVSPAGWEIDLPDGWRALSDAEMKLLTSERVPYGSYKGQPAHAVFVRPVLDRGAPEKADQFSCSVSAYEDTAPPEVLPPEKSPDHARIYRARARSLLRKGSYTDARGNKVVMTRHDVGGAAPVQVDKEEPGTLELLSLGDRDAYFWRAAGTRYEKPVQVATFYTAYDRNALDCAVVADPENAGLVDAFAQAVRTVRISDGAAHPMELSLMSRYRRWWPWTHPALQLYWLPIPVFLLGLGLALRGD